MSTVKELEKTKTENCGFFAGCRRKSPGAALASRRRWIRLQHGRHHPSLLVPSFMPFDGSSWTVKELGGRHAQREMMSSMLETKSIERSAHSHENDDADPNMPLDHRHTERFPACPLVGLLDRQRTCQKPTNMAMTNNKLEPTSSTRESLSLFPRTFPLPPFFLTRRSLSKSRAKGCRPWNQR